MCLTHESLKRHMNYATLRSLKFWRCFCFAYLSLIVFFYVRFVLFLTFMKQFEPFKHQFHHPNGAPLEELEVDYPEHHEEAKNFITGMIEEWDTMALIFDIRLKPQDTYC